MARTMRLLAVAVGGALLVVMLTRGAARLSVPPEAPPPREAARPEETTPPEPLAALPARDIFRYAEPTPPPSSRLSAGAQMQSEPPAPGPAPVRLIGLVRRGGRLCAALAISGEIDLAGAGETAGTVSVLSVDEDQGVRVRLPDGSELLLPLPQ